MTKILWRLSFICCIFFITHAVSAQVPELIRNTQFRQDAQAAVDSLYNFNPDGAEKRLEKWKEKYPHHPLWKLMDGMEFWWQILSDLNDTSHDEQFYKIMEEVDYAAAKLLYKHPGHADALIIRTVANGYIARQHSNREEWVTSLNTARKAYSAYGYLKDNIPDLPDLKLAEGLKLYYSEYLPEAYPVVKTVSWFLPDGDKQKGLENMREAAKKAIFARAEATYFLGNINYNYEHNFDKAGRYFRTLYEHYPHNNYYARLLVKSDYKMGRYQQAMAVIDSSLKRWDEKDLPFKKVLDEELYFWKGRILYRNGNYDQALPYLKKSLSFSENLPRSRHRDFYPASAYYAGMALQQSGKSSAAVPYLETVLDAKTGDKYKSLAHAALDNIHK